MNKINIFFILLLSTGCSLFGIRTEETPEYKVIMKQDNFEIRKYESYIIAKTVEKGEFKKVQGKAFRRLAGYIFGKNEKEMSLSMTAPVTQSLRSSEKIAMTAPVSQFKSKDGWVMTFSMPSKYKMQDLPKPLDKKVTFEVVKSKIMASIQYSWSGNVERNNKKAEELKNWLSNNKKYRIVSTPVYAGYDPPWTLPFLRKNEILFEIKEVN